MLWENSPKKEGVYPKMEIDTERLQKTDIHQKFNSLLFLACTSGYKSKKGEKRQDKKPSPFSEKADILPSTKKLKSVKKLIKSKRCQKKNQMVIM